MIDVYRQLSNFSTISWREQVTFQWDDDEVRFVLDQHAQLDFRKLAYWNNSPQIDISPPLGHIILILKQQSADRHIDPTRAHYPDSEPTSLLLFLLNAVCVATKQHIPIVWSLVWPDLGSNPRSIEYKVLECSSFKCWNR